MVNIIYRKEALIFEGSSDSFDGVKKDVSFDRFTFKVIPQKLTSLAQLPNNFKELDPDEISYALDLKVTNFDGIKIYNGSKQGLKLYYQSEKRDEKVFILIFSFGELQPGRFMCLFEAALSL